MIYFSDETIKFIIEEYTSESGVRKLKEINLASNYIENISPGSFYQLTNLTSIKLNANKIKYLFPGKF